MKLFQVNEEEFNDATETLRVRLKNGALRLVETESYLELVTAPEMGQFISELQKEELSGDIGKAGAETLAIILYREPVNRAEIDSIRGVNSSFILRNLLTRGLIERSTRKGSFYYSISPQLLEKLGHEQKYNLPRFSEFINALEAFEHNSP